MRHIFRRPFDLAQRVRREAFRASQGVAQLGASSAAFTAHSATITSVSIVVETRLGRVTRYSSGGVFRTRWPYAQNHAKVLLTYTDSDAIDSASASAALVTYVAEIRVGSSFGATIDAGVATGTFATFGAEITGGRRDPLEDAVGSLTTYQASIARTAGLGVSRTGHVSATPTGPYTRGSSRGRPARRPPPPIGTITKLK